MKSRWTLVGVVATLMLAALTVSLYGRFGTGGGGGANAEACCGPPWQAQPEVYGFRNRIWVPARTFKAGDQMIGQLLFSSTSASWRRARARLELRPAAGGDEAHLGNIVIRVPMPRVVYRVRGVAEFGVQVGIPLSAPAGPAVVIYVVTSGTHRAEIHTAVTIIK